MRAGMRRMDTARGSVRVRAHGDRGLDRRGPAGLDRRRGDGPGDRAGARGGPRHPHRPRPDRDTNQEGRYQFRNVAPGSYRVRVLRLGYAPVTDSAHVAPGETVALDFALTPAPVQLDEIVTTATGEQRKLEVGNAVSTIDAARIAEEAPITEFGNLISGRAAGVQVQKTGGTTGTGTRIRIRGSNSVSLSNEPLYYIDGIRMESGASSSHAGHRRVRRRASGAAPVTHQRPQSRGHRVHRDREGTGGRDPLRDPGLQRCRADHHQAGPCRAGRAGTFTPRPAPSTTRTPIRSTSTAAISTQATGIDEGWDGFCTIQSELDGVCTQTVGEPVLPARRPVHPPLEGRAAPAVRRQRVGRHRAIHLLPLGRLRERGRRLPAAAVRGGLGAGDPGHRARLPAPAQRPRAAEPARQPRRQRLGRCRPPGQRRLHLQRHPVRRERQQLPDHHRQRRGQRHTRGLEPGLVLHPRRALRRTGTASRPSGSSAGSPATGGPPTWLTTRATLGYDVTNRQDVQFFPTGQVADYLDEPGGAEVRQPVPDLPDLGGPGRDAPDSGCPRTSAPRRRSAASSSATTRAGTFATGRGLPAGSETITGAGSHRGPGHHRRVALRRELSWRRSSRFNERLFVTGALRFDDNSAFGENFDATVYPKASVSWLLSEEPFFGRAASSTRCASAAPSAPAGQQPGTTDALRYLQPGRREERRRRRPRASLSAASGNTDLKPERSVEFELGLDASVLKERVSLEFTYYNKRTTDALVERQRGPVHRGLRVPVLQPGRGQEPRLRARHQHPGHRQPRTSPGTWPLGGSVYDNELVELGEGVEPIIFGFGLQRHEEGYPLGGYWARPITGFADANGDGIIDADEVTVGDEAVFRGRALPNKEASLNSSLDALRRADPGRHAVRLPRRALHRQRDRVVPLHPGAQLPRGWWTRTAPLEEQARAQALLYEATEWGYFEPAWFIKLRELSFTFFAPDDWARRFRASRLSLTLAGRNLWTITDYSGVDPEVNAFAQDNFATSDFESQPQVQLLDRAPQHRLLRRGDDTMRQMKTATHAAGAPPSALSTGCGLLDTDQPNIVEPERRRDPRPAPWRAGSAPSPISPSPRTATAPCSRTGTSSSADSWRTSSCSPPRRRPSRRSTSGGCSRTTATLYDMFSQPAPGPRRGGGRRRGPAGAARSSPTPTPVIAEMLSLAGFTYIYFGESFCSGVPFSQLEGDRSSTARRRRRTRCSRRRSPASTRRWPSPGVQAERRSRSHHLPRRRRARAAPCSTWAASRRRPQQWSTCPPSSST